jgi:predicted GIY-YIG superfamily endonuclease
LLEREDLRVSFPDQGRRHPVRGSDEILFCKIGAKKEPPFDKLRVNGEVASLVKPFVLSLSKDRPSLYHQAMTFWTYMLHCRGGQFYVGHTDDLDRRMAQHQSGVIPGFTADRLPVALVWSEAFQTRDDAREAERRIKGWTRAKKMALIRGDWEKVSELSKGE